MTRGETDDCDEVDSSAQIKSISVARVDVSPYPSQARRALSHDAKSADRGTMIKSVYFAEEEANATAASMWSGQSSDAHKVSNIAKSATIPKADPNAALDMTKTLANGVKPRRALPTPGGPASLQTSVDSAVGNDVDSVSVTSPDVCDV
jgi:hypothetical protein